MLPAYLQLGIDFCLVVFGWHAGFWDQDLRRLMSGRGRRMGRIAGKELGLHSQSSFPLHLGTHTTPLLQGLG